jgi:signal transduction histidine kinase
VAHATNGGPHYRRAMHVDHPHRQPYRLGARQQRWFDGALATALLLPVAVLPVAGVGWIELVVAAAQIVPLYWRRSRPVTVFAAVAVASAAQAAVIDLPLWSQVAFPVAVYSVARFSTAVAGGVALAVGLAGSLVASVDWVRGFGGEITFGTVWSYVLTIATIVVTAWALGTLGRTRKAYVDALVERGHRLELEAEQQAELAATRERALIAREMHDVVAHGLSVMVVQADGARYAAAADPASVVPALETISTTGREALTEMRQMLGLLRTDEDAGVRPQPGLAGIPALLEEARRAGIVLDASLPSEETPDVPDGVGLTAYRLVQEALTNVRKHAGPGVNVEITLTVDDQLAVDVRDDGRGASAHDDGKGLGLLGMRERVAAHGGTFTAGPRRGGGFGVSARIPL